MEYPIQKREPKEIDKFELIESFSIPERNWETLIDYYNSNNKKRFQLKPAQCSAIIDYVKKSIPPFYIFKAIGCNYNTYNSKYQDMMEELEILNSKVELTEDENKVRWAILKNPLFILMSDVERAEGAAAIEDFTVFNDKSRINTELLPFKMKARYKDVFGDKKDDSGVVNINIKVGGTFADEI